MELDQFIIKKIYINDYIINTTLLNQSLSNILSNVLSNKLYKTNKLQHKINNILNKIDTIFKDYSGSKIFNLSYQPYNQFNITNKYHKNYFDKKWIIPIVSEKKTLNHNILKTAKKATQYRNNTQTILKLINGNLVFDVSSDFDSNPYENSFEDINNIDLPKESVNLLGNKSYEEVLVLDNKHIYNFNDANNIISTNNDCKVIREKQISNYYISSTNIPKNTKDGELIEKTIQEAFYEIRNVLNKEQLNITKFLVLNPMKLLHTNYNIYLGNTISYLTDILYKTNINIDSYINNINSNDTDLIDLENLQNFDAYTIDKKEFNNQYQDNKSHLWDYLKIIKNIKNYNKIYSIRILKYIYHIFGYDLNKIPHCYIYYLQNILDSNIKEYINSHFIFNYTIFTFFEKYKTQKSTIDTPLITEIKNIYGINNISFNTNDNSYSILINNSHDNGLLHKSHLYFSYLQSLKQSKETLIKNIDTILPNDNCKNYRIVKKYLSLKTYEEDNFKNYVHKEFSQENFIIEYHDIIHILQNNEPITFNLFKNKLYYINSILTFDERNVLDNNSKNIIEINNTDKGLIHFENLKTIITQKIYLYNILFNTTDINEDILYNKLLSFKYNNKKYIQLSYQTIENDNIFIIANDLYQYNSELDNITKLTDSTIHTIEKTHFDYCKESSLNKINNEEIDTLNDFYTSINNNLNQYKELYSQIHQNKINNNDFYNDIIQRKKSYITTEIYFQNLPKIEFPISHLISNDLSTYLSNYKLPQIKKHNLETILEEINTNIHNYEFMNKIKITDKLINEIDKLNKPSKWSSIHHFINDYELLSYVIENPNNNNRAYYKLWELLLDDNIVYKTDFKQIALAEAPGNFVKCVKNLQTSSWDNYIIFTLLDDKNTTTQGDFFTLFRNNIFGYTEDLKPEKEHKYTGNLTNINEINIFIDYISKNNLYADLVTADGGMEKNVKSENDIDFILEEFNHIPLFLGEIITALFTQKIGGSFILKMYDILYSNSVNLLIILSSFYKKIRIIKPYTSRPCNSEKYIKCSDFIGFKTEEEKQNIKTNLLQILNELNKNHNSTETKQFLHFNILQNLPNLSTYYDNILDFNNSTSVKTRSLYTEYIYDILKENNSKQLKFIDTYFGRTTFHLKNVLFSDDKEDKGYFIEKIENCIKLAQYLQLKNQPLKLEYINYYKLMKDFKKSVLNTNIYPPHFKDIYKINSEPNLNIRTTKIYDFVTKYCILFEKAGVNKILDQKIMRYVELFITNSFITNIDNIFIFNIKNNKNNLDTLYPYLIDICRINDISKEFNLYVNESKIISLIKNFQNNIRTLLGYYLCKYTYIPLYEKYKIYNDVQDQIKVCGIQYKSHWICCFSGNKLDKEEFDDFMADNIHRSINYTDINDTETNLGDKCIIIDNLSTEQKICFKILSLLKISAFDKISSILNKQHYFNSQSINDFISNINDNYTLYIDTLIQRFDKLFKPTKIKSGSKPGKNNYEDNKNFYTFYKIKTEDFVDFIDKYPKLNDSITFINKKKLKHNLTIDKTHILIINLLEILLLQNIYSKYSNVILYSLYQYSLIKNFTFEKTFKEFKKIESTLIHFIYTELDDFDILYNQLKQPYNLDIKLPHGNFEDYKKRQNLF